jgi:uncharacterized protein YxeA
MKSKTIIVILIVAVSLIVFGILFYFQVNNWVVARKTALVKYEIMEESNPNVQSKIKALVDQFFKDGSEEDLQAMDDFHLDSPKFSRVEGNGILNYEEDRELEKAFYAERKLISYTISNHKVDVFDDTAISSFHIDLKTVSGIDTSNVNAKASLVFVDYNGVWKVVHKHFSPRN